MKKKIIALFMLLTLFTSTMVMASDGEGPVKRVEPHCGKYATHDMLSWGIGSIITTSGKTIVDRGSCFQCARCYLVLICTGEPTLGAPIGSYSTWQPREKLTSFATVLQTNTYHYTSSSKLTGMSFRDTITRKYDLAV